MAFGWLGTFRQGSWQVFRRFLLEERRDIGKRIRVIESELSRIGQVTVIYGSDEDDDGDVVVTETRVGFLVTQGSSLGKLIQVYVAQGGNPFDISLFLTPDQIVIMDPEDTSTGSGAQPYEGVAYPKSGSYTPGQRYEGGFIKLKKYLPARIGGRRKLQDSRIATRVGVSRRWLNKEIAEKREDTEARIIKLCDLREQLLQEIDDITSAVAGVTSTIPAVDEDQDDNQLTVAQIVKTIDSIFYEMDETNTPDFAVENTEALGAYPFLLTDDPEEENTAL